VYRGAVNDSLGLGQVVIARDCELVDGDSVDDTWFTNGSVIKVVFVEEGKPDLGLASDQLNPDGVLGKTDVPFHDLLKLPA